MKSASVLHARYQLENSGPGAEAGARGGSLGALQTARGEFDFDTGDRVYTAKETVAPHMRLKVRKLKITAAQ